MEFISLTAMHFLTSLLDGQAFASTIHTSFVLQKFNFFSLRSHLCHKEVTPSCRKVRPSVRGRPRLTFGIVVGALWKPFFGNKLSSMLFGSSWRPSSETFFRNQVAYRWWIALIHKYLVLYGGSFPPSFLMGKYTDFNLLISFFEAWTISSLAFHCASCMIHMKERMAEKKAASSHHPEWLTREWSVFQDFYS